MQSQSRIAHLPTTRGEAFGSAWPDANIPAWAPLKTLTRIYRAA
jgi:hypothetical protein